MEGGFAFLDWLFFDISVLALSSSNWNGLYNGGGGSNCRYENSTTPSLALFVSGALRSCSASSSNNVINSRNMNVNKLLKKKKLTQNPRM